MKTIKVLLSMAFAFATFSAFAATTSTTLTINGLVQSSCQINVSTRVMTFAFVGTESPAAGATQLTFQCNANQNADILVASASGVNPQTAFQLRNAANPTLGIPYSATLGTIVPAPGSSIAATGWSLINAGGVNAIAQGSPVISGTTAQLGGMMQSLLTIAPSAPVAGLPSGTYSDVLTFTMVY